MENKTSTSHSFGRKILFSFVSIVSILLILAMTLSSCGNEISDIVIKDSDKPRTSYVQGQELDFSDGVLTVISGGSETSIPLTDPEVVITGYDKNTLGKQTVTVSYRESSTTIEVNVAARMVADGFKSNYFVGDTFDKTQGRLKITKDDGKTTSVNFDSDLVSVTSFDSSTAGDKTVTVTYNDGTVSYQTSFTVKVYGISEVIFTKPRKTVYASHDGELSLAGGYFTVKADGANLSTPVALTLDMASGFDLSAATPAHRENALKQTVVFTYAGQSFNFEISILYSGVSVVMDAAAALKDVEITGRDTEISEELSAIAIDAANEYFKLTTAKKALISDEDLDKVMRPAAICVYRAFLDAAEKFATTFKVDTASGSLLIQSESYDVLKAAIGDFENTSDPFNVYAVILNGMKEEFKDLFLFSEVVDEKTVDVKIADYVKSPSNDELSFYVNLFKYMLNVSDILKPVPDDWTMETLENYKDEITEAFKYITSSDYIGPNFNGVYNSISSWREKNDYFEIIYIYYMYVVGDEEAFFDSINSNQGLRLHLPGELQTWYTSLSYGANILMSLLQNVNTADLRLYDMTAFMYHYRNAKEAIDVVKASENQLYVDIYNFIGGDYLTYSLIEHPQALGYLYHASTMLESENFEALWESYLDIASFYVDGKRLNIDEEKAKFDKVLSDMAALTPGELYGFISSMSLFYSDADADKYAFDYKDNMVRNIFAYLMSYYDAYNFGSESRVLMQLLLVAEKCAIVEGRGAGYQAFADEMAAFLTMYNDLEPEKKDKLQQIAGDLYNKYVAIYTDYASTATPDLGASAEDYEVLKNAVADFYTVMDIIYSNQTDDETKQYYYPLLFAFAEKAIARYYNIVNNGTDEAVLALCTREYSFSGKTYTLDNAMLRVKSEFYYNMTMRYQNYGTQENPRNISFWITYSDLDGFRAFIASVADTLMNFKDGETLTSQELQTIFAAYRQLKDGERAIFNVFGINIYYDMLLNYFTSGGASENLARAILQVEIGYAEFCVDKNDTDRLKYFTDLVAAAKTEYNKLTDEEKDALDPLLTEFYNYYLEKYNEQLDA